MKKSLLTALAVLLIFLLIPGCQAGPWPTEPSVPTAAPTAPPTTAPSATLPPTASTEPADALTRFMERSHFAPEEELLGGYRYVGDSNVIQLEGYPFTFTIPEDWMGRVEVIVYVEHSAEDIQNAALYLHVVSKDLIDAYMQYGERTYHSSMQDYTILLTRTPKDSWDATERLAPLVEDGYCAYAGEDGEFAYYIETLSSHAPDHQNLAIRDTLLEEIGQEQFDEIVGDLTCTPDEALAMFQLTAPAA